MMTMMKEKCQYPGNNQKNDAILTDGAIDMRAFVSGRNFKHARILSSMSRANLNVML